MKKDFLEPVVNVMRINNYDIICISNDDQCGKSEDEIKALDWFVVNNMTIPH